MSMMKYFVLKVMGIFVFGVSVINDELNYNVMEVKMENSINCVMFLKLLK